MMREPMEGFFALRRRSVEFLLDGGGCSRWGGGIHVMHITHVIRVTRCGKTA